MREERDLVRRFQFLRRARDDRRRIPLVSHHHSGGVRGRGEPPDDVGRVDRSVRSIVPAERERLDALFRRPHVVGYDRNGIVEADDLAHAHDGFGFAVIDADQLAAHDGTRCDRGDLHSGQPDVDAILRRTVHLRRGVEALGGCSDQLELPRILQGDLRRHRKLRGRVGERAVRQLAAGRGVRDDSPVRSTRRWIYLPGLGGRCQEHGARGRTRSPQRLVQQPHRSRRAGHLHAEDRKAV